MTVKPTSPWRKLEDEPGLPLLWKYRSEAQDDLIYQIYVEGQRPPRPQRLAQSERIYRGYAEINGQPALTTLEFATFGGAARSILVMVTTELVRRSQLACAAAEAQTPDGSAP